MHLLGRARVDAQEVLYQAGVEAQHAGGGVAGANGQDRPAYHRPAVLVHLRPNKYDTFTIMGGKILHPATGIAQQCPCPGARTRMLQTLCALSPEFYSALSFSGVVKHNV